MAKIVFQDLRKAADVNSTSPAKKMNVIPNIKIILRISMLLNYYYSFLSQATCLITPYTLLEMPNTNTGDYSIQRRFYKSLRTNSPWTEK